MLILLLTIWRVQMLEQVISILVSFPNGARRNLCNTGGPAKRYEMWMAISGAMCKFAGLGRNRTLRDVIVCWTYTMTDPARGMGYARLYRADTSSKTESLESHGAQGGNPVRQLHSFGVKCARCRVGEGAVSQNFFCEPVTDVSAAFLNIKSGETAWDTALSTIVPADKNPPQMPLVFVEFFENLLYFDRQVCTLGEKYLFVSLRFERDNKESGVTQPDEV